MKLSIVITHYKEPWHICRPLFDSINIQQAIDFQNIEVIVVQDGNAGGIDLRNYEPYRYKVRHILQTEHGVSSARNCGIRNATGDYIMFCDCDDMFHNAFGLYLIFSAMNEEADYISSTFIEENKIIADYKLVSKDNDHTFVHGKAFRKQFLIDNDLKFHEELTKHEDGVFVSIANLIAEKKKYIQTPFYIWKWNDQSVMRQDVKRALLRTYPELMHSKECFIEDLKKYGKEKDLPTVVAKIVLDSFYDFNKPEFNDPNNKELIEKAGKAFKKFYENHNAEYKQNDGRTLAELCYICRNTAYTNGLLIERITLPQFLTYITRL